MHFRGLPCLSTLMENLELRLPLPSPAVNVSLCTFRCSSVLVGECVMGKDFSSNIRDKYT